MGKPTKPRPPLPGTPEYAAMIRRIVAQAPPLTDLQRGRITARLWPQTLAVRPPGQTA